MPQPVIGSEFAVQRSGVDCFGNTTVNNELVTGNGEL